MAIRLDEARLRLLKMYGELSPSVNNTYNIGTSSLKFANMYATTFHGALDGNASTASELTSLTTTDQAANSDVWRRIWMCYIDNATGRPAYDDRFAIQTSAGILKAPTFQGALNGNATTATALTSSAGSTTQPIYFQNGKPVAITGTIANDISGNANTCNGTKLEWNGQIAWNDTGWIAAWNSDGTLIKALNKSNFAPASHTHNYAGSSSAGGIATSSYSLVNKGTLDTQDKLDNFLTASRVEYATFGGSNNVGLASNDGMMLSLAWTNTTYGAQIAFDDATTGLVKIRGKSNSWGNWYTLLHSGNYNSYALPLAGGTMNSGARISHGGNLYIGTADNAGWIGFQDICSQDSLGDGKWSIRTNGNAIFQTCKGAVWNDYAEYRSAESIQPGRVVREDKDGIMKLTTERLMPACEIISDTFGFAIGETDECKTPIATTGRVLAYTYEDRYSFELGDAVCSGPNGTVSKMTREELIMYPERMIGTVSEIPEYKTWGSGNVEVDGRIWIRIR